MKVKVIKEAKSKNELKDRAKKHKKANKKKAWGWFVNPNAGNVEYNVDFFNHAMGSDGGTLGTSGGASDGGGMGESLLQDLHRDNQRIKRIYGEEVYQALQEYCEQGNDLGNVLYTESGWERFEKWLINTKGIEIKEPDDYQTLEDMKEYYNRKWKPSKTAKREFAQKMNSIEDFCKENNISHSKTSDSYYFEIDGQKYRVSNHSVEASNYNSGGRYHNDGRRVDTIYIHAGKTRVMDIFNDLKAGKKLDSRGNIITEDIEKHDTLNPKIWNSDNTLKKEVKEKIDEIVDTFKENLLEDGIDLKIKDVIICGSNANYNYTENSDIDVHIISDTKDLDCNKKHLPIIYNAYKKMFNDSYGIEFYDTEVEIYVENDKTGVTSGGIYSVKDDKWLKEPSMVEVPEVDEKEFEEELSKWEDECNEILYNLEDMEDSIRNIDTLLDELYEMRQDSIQKEGEFSIGNLVFKELRNKGFLTNLKGVKKELQSRLMSLYDNE